MQTAQIVPARLSRYTAHTAYTALSCRPFKPRRPGGSGSLGLELWPPQGFWSCCRSTRRTGRTCVRHLQSGDRGFEHTSPFTVSIMVRTYQHRGFCCLSPQNSAKTAELRANTRHYIVGRHAQLHAPLHQGAAVAGARRRGGAAHCGTRGYYELAISQQQEGGAAAVAGARARARADRSPSPADAAADRRASALVRPEAAGVAGDDAGPEPPPPKERRIELPILLILPPKPFDAAPSDGRRASPPDGRRVTSSPWQSLSRDASADPSVSASMSLARPMLSASPLSGTTKGPWVHCASGAVWCSIRFVRNRHAPDRVCLASY